jgi:hypothetical protein
MVPAQGMTAIDHKGREWCQAYAESRELEKIKEFAEARDSRRQG